jgi:protease-4
MGLFSKKVQNHDDIVERFVFEVIREQRRARRFRYFVVILTFTYLFTMFFTMRGDLSLDSMPGTTHTALVELNGIIDDDTDASADKIATGLRKAFKAENAKGVLLRINSPGGSPVQAAYINAEITRLREKYPEMPFYVVVTDICASGGYYVAAAADKIYAHPSSLVGSIGVLINSFGFSEAMQKMGIERRLYTAGEHKGMLDPFLPEEPDEVAHVQTLLNELHQQFIDTVKKGRGDRLADDPTLFSGMFWSGEKAKELGLIDDFASTSHVAREILGAEKIVNYTPKKDYLERLTERLGAVFAKTFVREMHVRGATDIQ